MSGLQCIDQTIVPEAGEPCTGRVELRESLSGTGTPIPRCDGHWSARLDREEEWRRRYPEQRPTDFDPLMAGERWDEDDPWP